MLLTNITLRLKKAVLDKKSTKTIKCILIFLLLISVLVLATTIQNSLNDLTKYEFVLKLDSLILALIFCQGMLLAQACCHIKLLGTEFSSKYKNKVLMLSYSLAQIIRYTPGKVAGIASQSLQLSGKYTEATVWHANFSQFLITNVYSLLILIVVLLAEFYNNLLLLSLLLVAAFTTALFIKSDLSKQIFNFIYKLTKKKTIVNSASINVAPVIFLLSIEWLCYILFWLFILPAEFSLWNSVLLATLYAGASLLSALAIILPSGLIFREAIFISFGSLLGFPTDTLIIYSIIARLLMTFSDIIFFTLNYINVQIATRYLTHGK